MAEEGDGDSRERILFLKTRDGRARAYSDGNMGYRTKLIIGERGSLPE